MNNERTGLILEGGAMRGLFTAGVLDVLMENDIYTDGTVGVSAGACFGCNYKSKQIGRALRYNLSYCNDSRYCGVRTLLKTGNIFGADFCYHTIPNGLDPFDKKTFNESKMDFYVVSSDILTGKPVYHLCNKATDKEYEWLRASASMPLVSGIVSIDGYRMLDGGTCDSIPLRFFNEIGYEKNVVVLTQPKDFVKQPDKSIPLMKKVYRNYPLYLSAAENRHVMYNESRDLVFSQENEGKAFVICPDEPLKIKKIEHNPEVIQSVYDVGREKALSLLDDLKSFLNK